MSPESEDEVFSAAIAGLPKIAEVIATVPAEDRHRALEAAEQSSLQTARTLGYDELEAQLWASTIMVRLQMESKIADECADNEASLIPWPVWEAQESDKADT